MKKAIITGITGQDGSYLTELLLEKGYEVHGVLRRSSVFITERIDHLRSDKTIMDKHLFLHYGDLMDSSNLNHLVYAIKPDEIYNLAAQSHVKVSFEVPEYTAHTNAMGALYLIDAVRSVCPSAKFYQASTSEMFGGVADAMPKNGFNEQSVFQPRSPYAVAKLYAYWIVRNYREAYGLFATNGVLFNHESPRRGNTFVTKKIVDWLKRWRTAGQGLRPLQLGNLYASRDWGHAKDYVQAIWLALQHDQPDDFVVATGQAHTVKDFVEECFRQEGKNIVWHGQGLDEKGFVDDQLVVEIAERFFRPTEVDFLRGDASKARRVLGWKPTYDLKALVKDMREN